MNWLKKIFGRQMNDIPRKNTELTNGCQFCSASPDIATLCKNCGSRFCFDCAIAAGIVKGAVSSERLSDGSNRTKTAMMCPKCGNKQIG